MVSQQILLATRRHPPKLCARSAVTNTLAVDYQSLGSEFHCTVLICLGELKCFELLWRSVVKGIVNCLLLRTHKNKQPLLNSGPQFTYGAPSTSGGQFPTRLGINYYYIVAGELHCCKRIKNGMFGSLCFVCFSLNVFLVVCGRIGESLVVSQKIGWRTYTILL